MKIIKGEEDLKILVIAMITNIIVICAFIGLAISFQKWWIALLSILFYMPIKYKHDDDKNKKEEK